MAKDDQRMEKIISLAKQRGFIFAGSEIYGGLANSWDYGPLGVELKNNIRDWWWKRFVQERSDMVGLDAAILMNPKVWEASGHVSNFSDPLTECTSCHHRFRADDLPAISNNQFPITKKAPNSRPEADHPLAGNNQKGKCPSCGGELLPPKQFNLMFKTFMGTIEESANTVYLRPEIAQAMFVNFKNALNTSRKRLPFGIASVGKAFRNEITPGNFIFRTLEFDLMEFEYFVHEKEWEKQFEYWLKEQQDWLLDLGFSKKNIRIREHEASERAHYSKRTVDVEYHTPFGWKEMFGLAYRTDFDVRNHMEKSGQDLQYTDPETGETLIPHVIEPTFGLTRLLLMVLLESYSEEGEGKDRREVLKLHPRLAPYKAAVFPLLKNKPELVALARSIYDDLRKRFMVAWDERGNVGKRYYSQDQIGTPFCITVDFDSLQDNAVTVRDRDSMKQERVKIEELAGYLKNKF
ncbi:MAG: glycine--tRNA ligase [Parcubacteria group bacterium]|nr:glycine--tRNA ligase [Parcubacteria group bacterium]